jgi:hypothetical protein
MWIELRLNEIFEVSERGGWPMCGAMIVVSLVVNPFEYASIYRADLAYLYLVLAHLAD